MVKLLLTLVANEGITTLVSKTDIEVEAIMVADIKLNESDVC